MNESPAVAPATSPASAGLSAEADSSRDPSVRTLAPALKLFAGVLVGSTFACFAVEAYAKLILHLSEQYTYPLRTRSQTAWDFVLFANKFQHFGRPDFFQTDPEIPFPYPAPLAVAYEAFFGHHAHPLRLFFGFIVGAFALAGVLLCRALHRRGVSWIRGSGFVLVTLLLAYPVWFELKQGNIEICAWVLVALGVLAFCKDRPAAAAVCFGVAGSMKIFPFIFLGLLLAAKKYRETVYAIAAAAVSTLVSLWLVGPGIVNAWHSMQEGMATFRVIYILHLRSEEIGFDHSLFGIFKRFYHPLPGPERLGHLVDKYTAVAGVCGIALYFFRIRRLPQINQVLCLVVASLLLPPISFDYTLMHLYIPWAMLVLFAQERWQAGIAQAPGLAAAMVCLAVLVSPQSEFIWHEAHFGGQIKALVLVVLMGIGLIYRFEREKDGPAAVLSRASAV